MAKKKSVKSAKAALVRPKTSPYTSRPATVHFGVDRHQYYVPEVLLQKLENLPDRDPWTSEMPFENVDADTGHVLIHFLHTGTYQTLNDINIEEVDGVEKDVLISEFQKAVRALEAATKYGLSELQRLAQTEMERRGAEMNLNDAVRAISEDSIAGPLNDNTWLRDYVAQKVRSTFKHNMDAFSEPDFFDGISSPTLTKILARSVVSLYKEKVTDLERQKLANEKLSPSENGDRFSGTFSPNLTQLPSRRPASGSGAWPESVDKIGAFDDSSAAWDSHALTNGKSSTPEAEAREPAAQPIKKSKKSKKAAMLQKIAEHAEVDARKVDAPEPTSPQTSSASVVQEVTDAVVELDEAKAEEPNAFEEADQVPDVPMPEKSAEPPANEVTPSIPAADNVVIAGDSTPPIKKKKNKMKKTKMKNAIASPDSLPVPEPEPIPDIPPAEDFHGLTMKQILRLKKQIKAEKESGQLDEENADRLTRDLEEVELSRLLEEQEAIDRAEEEVAAAAAQKTAEDASALKTSDAIAAIIAAEAENVKTEGWSDWGEAAVTKKKKKKKKIEVCGSEVPEQPPAPPLPEAEPVFEVAAEPLPREAEPVLEAIVKPPPPEEEPVLEVVAEPPPCEPEPVLEAAVEPPPPPEAEPVFEVAAEPPEEIWGAIPSSFKKKKKKGKKAVAYEDPPVEPEVAPGSDLIEPNVPVDHAGEAPPTAEMPAIPEDDSCLWRSEHFSAGDRWKTCKPCMAFMRGVASRLHSEGFV